MSASAASVPESCWRCAEKIGVPDRLAGAVLGVISFRDEDAVRMASGVLFIHWPPFSLLFKVLCAEYNVTRRARTER
jgi:hypothetical protein